MAEQIIQQLGFDASGAIRSINDLVTTLGSLNQTLARTQRNLRNFGSGKAITNINAINRQLGTASQRMSQFGRSANQNLNQANSGVSRLNRSSSGLILSWETLSRIAIAQGIVRSVNVLTSELREAVDLSAEFGLRLTEIAAVFPEDPLRHFQQNVSRLNEELIETSRSFGFDILDLANAKYQEYQNQIEGSAESNRLFIASNKLARISAGEVSQSIEALSSVLNSYSLNIDNAERVSAALFKTVELGRIELGDIADQLGNVTPLARDAGIAFEEVFGALTVITRSGVSPSRALTQVRALINQLQKPTAEMQRLFEETFQVTNIEEAIQKFGSLENVIRAVAAEAEGNSRQIARFFTNIRARNAFLSLSGNADLLAQDIREIGEAAEEGTLFLDRMLEQFDESQALQFTKAVNELKLEMLDLAQGALPTLTTIIRTLSTGVDNLGTTVGVVSGGVLATFSVRLLAASTAANILAASSLRAQAGIIGLGFSIGFITTSLLALADQRRIAEDLVDDFSKIENVRLDSLREINEDTSAALRSIERFSDQSVQALSRVQQAGNSARDAIRQQNDIFVGTTTSALNRLVSVREDFVNRIEQQIEGAEQRITKNLEDQASIRQQIADNEFERRIRGFDELRQATFRFERAQRALSQARRSPTTLEGLDQRLEELSRAQQLAEEAINAARGSGNRTALFRSETLLRNVFREQLEAKEAQAQLDAQSVAAAEQRRDEEQRRLESLRENVQQLQKNISLFTDGGALLSPEARQDAIKQAREAFDAIQQDAFTRSDLDFGDLLGLTDLQLRFNQTLSQIQIEAPREELLNALEQAAEGVSVGIPVDFIIGAAGDLGLDVSDFDPLRPLQGLQNIQEQVGNELQQNALVQQRLNTAVAEEQALREQSLARVQQIVDLNKANPPENILGGVDSRRRKQQLEDTERLRFLITDIANKRIISEEDIQNVEDLLNAFNRGATDLPGTGLLGEPDFIVNLVNSLRELQSFQFENIRGFGQLNEALSIEADLTELQTAIDNAAQRQLQLTQGSQQFSQSLQNAQTNQQTLNESIRTGAGNATVLSDSYRSLTTEINQAVQAQQRLNSVQSQSTGGGSFVPRMFGGPLYRADGGFTPRGTDTVPAMLSPGEFVVNARSARQFASQLVAMNAGINPTYRQEGGPVVNNSVNVGDINVNGTSDPDETARRVVSQLRREFRRGTASRFN